MSTTAAPKSTPPSASGGDSSMPSKPTEPTNSSQRNVFLVMAAHLTWQLAIVVLVPVIGGAELDKALGTHRVWTFTGLGVALVGAVIVMWRAVRAANRLPVPKITEEQRREIQKQYDEEDDE